MSTPNRNFLHLSTGMKICLAALFLPVAVLVWIALGDDPPPALALSVVGFKTNAVAEPGNAGSPGETTISVLIAMTNVSTVPVTYYVREGSPPCQIFQPGAPGPRRRRAQGSPTHDEILAPGQGLVFSAKINRALPCQIGVQYVPDDAKTWLRGSLPNFLPARLLQWLRWNNRANIARTPMIPPE